MLLHVKPKITVYNISNLPLILGFKLRLLKEPIYSSLARVKLVKIDICLLRKQTKLEQILKLVFFQIKLI